MVAPRSLTGLDRRWRFTRTRRFTHTSFDDQGDDPKLHLSARFIFDTSAARPRRVFDKDLHFQGVEGQHSTVYRRFPHPSRQLLRLEFCTAQHCEF